MDGYAFTINLLTGLFVGLGVRWLADWLPAYGSPRPLTRKGYSGLQRRWPSLAGPLFGMFLSYFLQNPEVGSPANHWILWSYFALFLLILIIDLEHRRVLNIVVYPMLLAGLVLAMGGGGVSLSAALLGGLTGFATFLLFFVARPGALGAGDVKLAALIGVLVGFPSVLVALATGIVLGGIAALGLLLSRRVGMRGSMAYAPYLSAGAMVSLLYGPTIVNWYVGRLGIF